MLGLALSMGASGVLFPRHADGATTTEPVLSEATVAVPEAPASPPVASESSSEPEQHLASGQSSTSLVLEHTVQPGQTLWQIAQAYQISVEKIARFNGVSPTTTLRVGQQIRVPVSEPALDSPKALTENVAALDATVEETAAPAQLESVETAKRDAALGRMRQERDQLRNQLRALRDRTEQVEAAEKQQAEAAYSSPESTDGRVRPRTEAQPTTLLPGSTHYAVKPGDTLGAIASAHGVSAHSLAMANQLRDPHELQIEQSLVIPPAPAENVPQVVPSPAAEPVLQSAVLDVPETTLPAIADPAAPEVLRVDQVHRIGAGETVAQIARRYNIPSSALIAANQLSNPDLIRVGETLRIPAAVSAVRPGTVASTGRAATPDAAARQQPAALPPSEPSFASPSLDAAAETESEFGRASSTAVFSTEFLTVNPPESAAAAETVLPPGATEAASAETPESSSTLYVSRLVSEMSDLSESVRQRQSEPAAPASAAPADEQPTLVTTTLLSSTPAPESDDPARLNPELRAAVGSESERVQSPSFERRQNRWRPRPAAENRPPAPETQPQTVATAPLGSEEYAPLRQPLVGRLVSPELPPLPGADNFLPRNAPTFNGYVWPARGVLTSGYGWRWGRMHRGLDIAAPVGTPIYAAAAGVVQFSGWNSGGYGNMVEIRHPDGSMTRYAHNSRNLVRVGQQVEQGQHIAAMGSTGYSTGPHVHFEVHLPNQGTVNPIAMLPRRGR